MNPLEMKHILSKLREIYRMLKDNHDYYKSDTFNKKEHLEWLAHSQMRVKELIDDVEACK